MSALSLYSALQSQKKKKMLLKGGAIWYLYLREEERSTRRIWTRNWLTRTTELGAYETLLSELREEDQKSFINFLRVTPTIFDNLLGKVGPLIEKQDTRFRRAISPAKRLAMTLRYLATGETFKSLAYLFRVGSNTLGQIVPETCAALHSVLADEYFKCPQTVEDWLLVAEDYMKLCQFPNCLGSLDGKHVSIRKPACSGLDFFNYKHCFSIVLLALVDAQYKFIFCDIGSQGRCSDAGIFRESDLNRALLDKTLSVPAPKALPGKPEDDTFPFCIIADEAFPLRENLMKPFPHRGLTKRERIFNYRLSRARRCVEQAFGIMATRFRVILNPIAVSPAKVDHIIKACCVLHNMLRTIAPTRYVARPDDDEAVSKTLGRAQVDGRRSATRSAKQCREYLCDYFNSNVGSVPWQDAMI